jgi:hypothetical protein
MIPSSELRNSCEKWKSNCRGELRNYMACEWGGPDHDIPLAIGEVPNPQAYTYRTSKGYDKPIGREGEFERSMRRAIGRLIRTGVER